MFWKDYIIIEYRDKKRSTSDLAKELGKNPKLIRDALIKANVPIRSHSEAQKNAINNGRAEHIKEKRTDEAKSNIADGMKRLWEEMSPEASAARRADMSKRAKENWENRPNKEKNQVKKTLRHSNKKGGSRAEHCIGDLLGETLQIERRSQSVIYPYEVDIWLPELRIAIEVDGPTHFSPIYGEANLKRVKNRDAIKDAAILALGIPLIRCQNKQSSYSLAGCRRAVETILKVIEEFRASKKISVSYVDII